MELLAVRVGSHHERAHHTAGCNLAAAAARRRSSLVVAEARIRVAGGHLDHSLVAEEDTVVAVGDNPVEADIVRNPGYTDRKVQTSCVYVKRFLG